MSGLSGTSATRAVEWRAPSASGDRIDEWVAVAASRFPGRTAVEAPDAVLTYAEMIDRSDALAAGLVSHGVAPGSLVGLCCSRSAALVVAALAILRCGAAYVALDPDAPAERLDFMLADCSACAVVVDHRSAARLAQASVPVLIVDPGAPHVAVDGRAAAAEPPVHRRPGGPPDAAVFPGLAYVVYTSGSTGSPKGVLVDHANLASLVRWHLDAFGLTEVDRTTLVANPAFDASVWEIWPTLTAGACLVVPDAQTARDGGALHDFFVDRRIGVAFVPTALVEPMIDMAWPANTALRHLLTGGDALHARPPEDLPFVLVNNYGLSEATVVSTSGAVAARGSGAPSIGRAIAGTRLTVVDDQLRPVPDGQEGELVVSGPAVARGYLNRAELDRARFVPDDQSSGRRLRTGDLVVRRTDGQIDFLGRLDDQVKIRGYRIEVGEICAALDRHPGVASCHVRAGGPVGARRLEAFLVPPSIRAAQPGQPGQPAVAELRDHLRGILPEYMIPSSFTWVAELPLTPHGKIDDAALVVLPAAGDEDPTVASSSHEGWEVELGTAVAALVSELLDGGPVDPDADFFLLGGHSLLGAQLVGRASTAFGVDLRLRDVFDHPTVAGLTARVAELMAADLDSLDNDEIIALAAGDR